MSEAGQTSEADSTSKADACLKERKSSCKDAEEDQKANSRYQVCRESLRQPKGKLKRSKHENKIKQIDVERSCLAILCKVEGPGESVTEPETASSSATCLNDMKGNQITSGSKLRSHWFFCIYVVQKYASTQ